MALHAEQKMDMLCGTDGIDHYGYAYPGMSKVTQNEDVSARLSHVVRILTLRSSPEKSC
jgi:hypothetical protein